MNAMCTILNPDERIHGMEMKKFEPKQSCAYQNTNDFLFSLHIPVKAFTVQ
jgi:hypothetical protein